MLKKESPCKTHDNQEVDLHCQDCNILICVLCLKDHHHNHKTTSLQEFISAETNLLSKNLEKIDKMSTDEKKQQEEIALLIKHDGEKAKEQVKKLTKKLTKALLDNEQKLLNEIQKSITKADKNLRIIRHTTESQEYIKYFIQNGTASEMIDTRDEECSQNFTYNPFEKRISGMEFKPNDELCDQVKTGLGLVQSIFKKADSKMSSIKVEPSDIEATKKAKLSVELKTSEGDLVVDEALENVNVLVTPADFRPRVNSQLMAGSSKHKVELRGTGSGRRTQPHSYDGSSKPHDYTRSSHNSSFTSDSSYGTTPYITTADSRTTKDYSKPIMPISSEYIRLGQRVVVMLTGGNVGRGVVRYVGPLSQRPGAYVGVELDNKEGKHDGSFDGNQYFKCKPNRGIIVKFDKVIMCYNEQVSAATTLP